LTVLQSDNPAMRNALRQDLLAIAPNQPEQVMNLLALLGFTDDAIAIGDHDLRVDSVAEDSAQFLFSPYTAALRRDPRFMTLAARFGLVDYWRSTGHWPDFCSEPGLPYDCRQVAAKVAAQPQPR
jgi:hypothetical protein